MRAILVLIVVLFSSTAQAATYSLTDGAGNRQCILYDGVSKYTPAVGWTLSNGPVANCVPVNVTSTPNPSVISGLQFWQRFTPTEQAAIATATQQNVALNVWLITALAASSVDLTDPLTKQGLDALVSAGLLTSARETAILTP